MVLTLAHLLCPLHPLHRQVFNPRLGTPTFQRRRSERSLLGLGRRVVLFGGGRQSDARGGGVRRLWITDRALTRDEIAALARIDMPSANPLSKGAAICIQSAARRRQAIRLVKDLRKKEGLPETRENSKEAPKDSRDEDESDSYSTDDDSESE